MVAPFNQAWMLLKQRGHELNLPPQSAGIKGMGSPQDLTDRRVDEATMARRALDKFERLNSMRHPTFSNAREATNELDRRREITNEMKNQRNHASISEGNERFLQEGQSELDQAILARMGQQPEADEMEAMGVPEMSRTLGGTPPANLGRAGSSGRPPVGSGDLSEDLIELDPKFAEGYTNQLNRLGPTKNPFPKPAGQNVRGDLMNWAAGAGRRGTGKPALPDKVYPEEMMEEPLEGFHNSPAPAGESAPTPMDAPSTVAVSPRLSRKNRPGESAPTPRMEGRADRRGLPFPSPYKQ
tara:strand:+ start:4047 stop:4940 length:894 start_codon:yes stop_codon:yes gene_type:complete